MFVKNDCIIIVYFNVAHVNEFLMVHNRLLITHTLCNKTRWVLPRCREIQRATIKTLWNYSASAIICIC